VWVLNSKLKDSECCWKGLTLSLPSLCLQSMAKAPKWGSADAKAAFAKAAAAAARDLPPPSNAGNKRKEVAPPAEAPASKKKRAEGTAQQQPAKAQREAPVLTKEQPKNQQQPAAAQRVEPVLSKNQQKKLAKAAQDLQKAVSLGARHPGRKACVVAYSRKAIACPPNM
jgi:hypothetical protein